MELGEEESLQGLESYRNYGVKSEDRQSIGKNFRYSDELCWRMRASLARSRSFMVGRSRSI